MHNPSSRLRVLWLVSWYPNKTDAFDGDFIQRHARAVALYHDVHVLFIKPVAGLQKTETFVHTDGGLTEQIVYVPLHTGPFAKLLNVLRWQAAGRKAIRQYRVQWTPALVHVHVPWKAGLLALWLKQTYDIPYGITEHWGIYNNVVTDNFSTRSSWQQQRVTTIFRKASFFITVSRFLAEGVQKYVAPVPYSVVPNVVDTGLFFYEEKPIVPFTFIHVSNMVGLKNVTGILDAFEAAFSASAHKVQLLLVGPGSEKFRAQAAGFATSSSVLFVGEVEYKEVAALMRQSHVFVLNSDMENSPCVIGEALCCGLPVIATHVGGIPELVNESNSVLVAPRQNSEVSQVMHQVYSSYKKYDRLQISASATDRFSMAAVGKAISLQYAAKISSGG